MKKQRLLALVLLPFLISGCSGGEETTSTSTEPVDRNIFHDEVEVTMASQFSQQGTAGEYTDTCEYNDEWFFEDSSKVNNELALASAMASAAASSNSLDNKGAKIAKFLKDTGYSDIEKNYYFEKGLTLDNSIGAIIGQKVVRDAEGKEYTLLAVLPRSAGYGAEWVGNFDIAADGTATGFMLARDEMLRFMKHYIDSNEITGDLKIWSAGYSRGAATTNLFSAYVTENPAYFGDAVSIDPSDVYAYTIGTPAPVLSSLKKSKFLNVSGPRKSGYHDSEVPAYTYSGDEGTIVPTDEKYNHIHNFVAIGDYVTKVAPSKWGFTRFGKSEEIVYGSKEMIAYLTRLSPATAYMFSDGKNYTTKEPTSTFNFDTLEIEDAKTKMSANEVLDSHIDALVSLVPTVKDYANSDYKYVLGALTAAFDCDSEGLIKGITSLDKTELIKTVATVYMSYVAERFEYSDKEAFSAIVMDLLGLLGKPVEDRENYNDQQFLKDLFDLLINDYQTSEVAKTRLEKIADLIPAPYGELIKDLAEYAKTKETTITYCDDFLLLFSNYYVDHDDDETINELIDKFATVIPEEFVTVVIGLPGKEYDDDHYPTTEDKLKAALRDTLRCCVEGSEEQSMSANSFRAALLMMLGIGLSFKSYPKLASLLNNGVKNEEGEPQLNTPEKLADTLDEILSIILPVDEETSARLTLKEAANKGLVDILKGCRTEKNAAYIDTLINKVDAAQKLLLTFLFKPGKTYSLAKDIDNALTFYKSITFLAPSHFSDLYICYLKTQVE